MPEEEGLEFLANGDQVPPGVEPISQEELPEGTLTAAEDEAR